MYLLVTLLPKWHSRFLFWLDVIQTYLLFFLYSFFWNFCSRVAWSRVDPYFNPLTANDFMIPFYAIALLTSADLSKLYKYNWESSAINWRNDKWLSGSWLKHQYQLVSLMFISTSRTTYVVAKTVTEYIVTFRYSLIIRCFLFDIIKTSHTHGGCISYRGGLWPLWNKLMCVVRRRRRRAVDIVLYVCYRQIHTGLMTRLLGQELLITQGFVYIWCVNRVFVSV